jgi:hypothetical protein
MTIFDRESLADFCNYILAEYSDPYKLKDLYEFSFEGNQGGICDMTLLSLWSSERPAIKAIDKSFKSLKLVFNHEIRSRITGPRLIPKIDIKFALSREEGNVVKTYYNSEGSDRLINLHFNADSKNLLWGTAFYCKIFSTFAVASQQPPQDSQILFRIILSISALRAQALNYFGSAYRLTASIRTFFRKIKAI